MVDESNSMEGEHKWLPSMVKRLEQELKSHGVGNSTDLPNRYMLVGYGSTGEWESGQPHLYNTSSGDTLFSADDFDEVSKQLFADPHGGLEDGYLAIDYAIAEHKTLRRQGRVAINLILVSDEDRDDIEPELNLTRRSIKVLLKQNHVVLNVIVDNEFGEWVTSERTVERTVVGVDSSKTGYWSKGDGGYGTVQNARVGRGYQSTRRQYATLALELHGAAWNINHLRQGGAVSAAFTKAFTDVKTSEISRHLEICDRCTCVRGNNGGQMVCQRHQNQRRCRCLATQNKVGE